MRGANCGGSDGGVLCAQIANMWYGFGTLVLVLGGVHGAVTHYNSADLGLQQPAASNVVQLDLQLASRPAASYAVELNRRRLQPHLSRNMAALDELDLQPQASNVIELDQLDSRNEAAVNSLNIVQTSGSSAKGRSGYGHRTLSKEDERKARLQQQPKSTKSGKSSSSSSPPKNINEAIKKGQPSLAGVGSSKSPKKLNGDLNKSGSYLSGNLGDGFEEGYDKEKHFDKEGGQKYNEARKSEAGEKAQKGYKKEEDFDKAENEKHGKEENKAIVAEKQGEKKAHAEEEKQFGKEYKGTQGEKEISVTKKGGHKKGRKKTGFHKVHHKDEFKKDEVFYDESHGGDEHEEHAHEHEKHSKKKGGSAKKALVDSQYHEGHGEKQGVQDKGHSYEEASGHKKEAGQEEHHNKESEYDKKDGVKEGKKYGHEEGGSSGGGYSDHDFF